MMIWMICVRFFAELRIAPQSDFLQFHAKSVYHVAGFAATNHASAASIVLFALHVWRFLSLRSRLFACMRPCIHAVHITHVDDLIGCLCLQYANCHNGRFFVSLATCSFLSQGRRFCAFLMRRLANLNCSGQIDTVISPLRCCVDLSADEV